MKLNRANLKNALFLALAGLGLGVSPAKAVVTYNQGDLLVGFFRTIDAQTYVVNVGSAATFRDWNNGANINLSLGNIATDLIALYGATWYDDPTLTWGVAGSPSNTSTVNGDPLRTLYAGRDPLALNYGFNNPGSAAWSVPSSTTRGTSSTSMNAFQNAFDVDTETANSTLATIQGTGDANNWTAFNPLGVAFSAFNSNITSAFTAGALAPGVESALDLWRVLHTNTGATEPGTVGVGQFQGTFYIDNAGQISFGAQAVPEPSRMVFTALGLSALAFRRRRKLNA